MTKKIGLSLVAATLLTSSAVMAFEDTKVTGGVKLWYQSMNDDAKADDGFFNRSVATGNESGDLVANIGITSKASEHVGLGMKLYAATTLGLENNVVSTEALNVGATNESNGVLNGDSNLPMWLGEAYMTYTAGGTTAKIGRQELDTPLAYTEKWNAAPNTFEALALINIGLIPDTTAVLAFVSRGNGSDSTNLLGGASTKTVNASFSGYWGNGLLGSDISANDGGGAYALGLLNKTSDMVPVNFWYYNVVDTANALWLDAKINMDSIGIDLIGAQVTPTGITDDFLAGLGDSGATTAMAAKVSAKFGDISAYGAFSTVSEGNLPVANTATNFKKTKLPTASIFSDGMYAAQPDTTSFKLGGSVKLGETSSLAVSYGSYAVGQNTGYASVWGAAGNDTTTSEIDVVYKVKLSEVNLAAMYINQSKYNAAEDTRQIIRIIAGVDF